MTISQERREQLRATVYAAIQATTTGPFWPDMLTALDELDAAEARADAADRYNDELEARYIERCRELTEAWDERDALQAQYDLMEKTAREANAACIEQWNRAAALQAQKAAALALIDSPHRVLLAQVRVALTDPPKADPRKVFALMEDVADGHTGYLYGVCVLPWNHDHDLDPCWTEVHCDPDDFYPPKAGDQ